MKQLILTSQEINEIKGFALMHSIMPAGFGYSSDGYIYGAGGSLCDENTIKNNKLNYYQQSICEQLSEKIGKDVNEFLQTIPAQIDEALEKKDFEKITSLTTFKEQIQELILG